jgi:hypothetical protein
VWIANNKYFAKVCYICGFTTNGFIFNFLLRFTYQRLDASKKLNQLEKWTLHLQNAFKK